MPKINLLPKKGLESKPLGRFLKWSLSYGRYIIVSVELVVFVVFFSRFVFDRQLADLTDEIEQKEAIIASAQEFEEEFRTIQNTISYIESLEIDRKKYLEILTTLERITPIQVAYKDVVFSEYTLTLSGMAQTNESFAQFLAQLKNIDDFSSISLDSLAKEEDTDDEITFDMTIEIRPENIPADQVSEEDE